MGAFMGALIGVLVGWFGYILIEAITGASLGKMILGLRGTLDGKKGVLGSMARACLKYCYLFPLLLAALFPPLHGVNIIYYLLSFVFFYWLLFALRVKSNLCTIKVEKRLFIIKRFIIILTLFTNS